VGTGSDTFEIAPKYPYGHFAELRNYFIGLALLAVIGIVIASSLYWRKELNKKKRIAELRKSEPEEKAQKLRKELKALEEAYTSKFISEESYRKEKSRIEAEVSKTRK
jgi:hypothetical protein